VPGAISWASRRDGVPPNLGASFPTVSNDAVVAFQSSSTNLTGFPDFNGTDDVFAVRMPLFAHGFESRDTGVW
jgi:hypothetical protein